MTTTDIPKMINPIKVFTTCGSEALYYEADVESLLDVFWLWVQLGQEYSDVDFGDLENIETYKKAVEEFNSLFIVPSYKHRVDIFGISHRCITGTWSGTCYLSEEMVDRAMNLLEKDLVRKQKSKHYIHQIRFRYQSVNKGKYVNYTNRDLTDSGVKILKTPHIQAAFWYEEDFERLNTGVIFQSRK